MKRAYKYLMKSVILAYFLLPISLMAQDVINKEKLKSLMSEFNVPAVGIGIIDDDQINVTVYGEIKQGLSAPENTIFSVASLTKPVFTMFVLKLVEEGKLDLNEPLYKYWVDPEIENHPYTRKLNTRHILSHQSGFSNWRRLNKDGKLAFNFEPGTDYQYSGEGFEYLRIALELKFKQTITEMVDTYLFSPIEMTSSRLHWDEKMNNASFAFWHDAKGRLMEPSRPQIRNVGAASTMMTTVKDFCKLGQYTMIKANSSDNLYHEMRSTSALIKKDYGKGLGWEVVTNLPNGEYALTHTGWSSGVKTMALLLPESKRGLIVFTNGDNGYQIYTTLMKDVFDVGHLVLKKMAGISDRELIALTASDVEKYAGRFLDSYGRILVVNPIENGIEVAGDGVPTNTLYPISKDIFVLKDFDVNFEFSSTDAFKIIVDGKVDCTAKRIK